LNLPVEQCRQGRRWVCGCWERLVLLHVGSWGFVDTGAVIGIVVVIIISSSSSISSFSSGSIVTILQASIQIKFSPASGAGDSVGRWVEGRCDV
jgi:hypothetical protein